MSHCCFLSIPLLDRSSQDFWRHYSLHTDHSHTNTSNTVSPTTCQPTLVAQIQVGLQQHQPMPHGLCSFKTEETISCSSTYYQLSQVSFRKTPQSHSHYPSTTTPILHAKHLWSSVTSTDLFQSPTIPHTHTTRRRAYSPQSRPCRLFHFYSSTAHHALGTNTP